ncbi:hypothetical protein G7054_g8564 [Neopestalotiopsis clavispora]|nr:hypothetical protein G7054_g8564 [Neopestalotiopsis clavispora]
MTVNDAAPPAIWSTIVDTRTAETPDRVFCEILEADWREKGPREITYAQFARAVNRVCWWFENEFGTAKDFEAFAYVGDNDLRYNIIMIAAQKSERTVSYHAVLDIILSLADTPQKMVIAELSRLTHEALLKLLETTNCFRWLGSSEAKTALGKTLPDERPGTKLYTFPSLDYWLKEDGVNVSHYPFNKTWEEAKPHPAFVIHSSGTTGIPKPLRHTLESVSSNDMIHRWPDGTVENPENGFSPMRGSRMIWAAPPQWLGGIWGHMFAPLFYDGVPVWPPVDHDALSPVPVVMEMLERVQPDGAFFVPSMARDLCQQPAALALVERLKFLVYGARLSADQTWETTLEGYHNAVRGRRSVSSGGGDVNLPVIRLLLILGGDHWPSHVASAELEKLQVKERELWSSQQRDAYGKYACVARMLVQRYSASATAA